MSLSRAESRRSMPQLSLARWITLVIFALLFVLVSAVLYVRASDSGYRGEEQAAIRLAKMQGGLAEVERAVSHTWTETAWVVFGKDAAGEKWVLWERAGGIEKLKQSDGFTESAILARFAEERPSARQVRVLPGLFQGQPAWEIRYVKTPRTDQQGIDFYSFIDGTLIKSYDLPGR